MARERRSSEIAAANSTLVHLWREVIPRVDESEILNTAKFSASASFWAAW